MHTLYNWSPLHVWRIQFSPSLGAAGRGPFPPASNGLSTLSPLRQTESLPRHQESLQFPSSLAPPSQGLFHFSTVGAKEFSMDSTNVSTFIRHRFRQSLGQWWGRSSLVFKVSHYRSRLNQTHRRANCLLLRRRRFRGFWHRARSHRSWGGVLFLQMISLRFALQLARGRRDISRH